MEKIMRTLAVLSSLSLLAGFLYYQTSHAPKSVAETPEPPTRLVMTSEDPEAPSTPAPKVTATPSETFIFSTKSGRIIPPSATPTESPPLERYEQFMPSSKSSVIVSPKPDQKDEQKR